jgi:hypothetical protein
MKRLRLAVVLGALTGCFLLVGVGHTSANDAAVSNANFSESRGCGPGVAGINRPYVSHTGSMPTSELILGPWGDMFGRTYYQVGDSLVSWKLPGSSKTLFIHNRILPALNQASASLSNAIASGKSYSVYSAFARNWRTVGGAYRPSEHAFGTAFDINPQSNPYSRDNFLRTDLPSWFINAFTDAGFCWGGSWIESKDAMHFSWSGPVETSGYPARSAPYPAVTSPTNYATRIIGFTSAVSASTTSSMTVADMTGEGAPDVVRMDANGLIEASAAVGNYAKVAFRSTAGSGGEEMLMGDYDRDGVSDVWVVNRSGSTVKFDVWTGVSDHKSKVTVTTNIPSSTGKLLLGYFDQDFVPDVYVLSGSKFVVYGSLGNFASAVANLPLVSGTNESWHFATGDYDMDGKADVYAIANGGAPALKIRFASGGTVTHSPGVSVSGSSLFEVGDYDGDGRDDLFVLTGSGLTISLGGNSGGAPDRWFQIPSTVPPDAGPKCIGPNGCATIGYVDDGGIWTLADRARSNPAETQFYYGNPGDAPFMGDWNCDGIDTPGLYRKSDGFVYLRQTNTQGTADTEFYFGNPGDIPLVGDFNGDGCDTVSLYRKSEHRIYIINALGEDGKGLGAADYFFEFGNPGDVPFTGDFDGDGIDEVGLRRPSNGMVMLKWTLSGGNADYQFIYGSNGDVPYAADWNGDGTDTIALYRPSNGDWYIRLTNSAGAANHTISFGGSNGSTKPIVGVTGP